MGVRLDLLPIVLFSDWTATEYGEDPIAAGDTASLMPLVINYLTPQAVAVIGMLLQLMEITNKLNFNESLRSF